MHSGLTGTDRGTPLDGKEFFVISNDGKKVYREEKDLLIK
jgi:hypothetical protein